MTNYPKLIKSGTYKTCHCQGIAVDKKKKFIYLSFTTMLIKLDWEGNFIGSVDGLYGHLGCISFSEDDGYVYGSIEYINDSIGKIVLKSVGREMELADKFYIAIFDVDKIDRPNMLPEEVMKCAFVSDATEDYLAQTTLSDGRIVQHRFGCAGIDGCAIGPDMGASCETDKKFLFIAYGVYLDTSRDDNDYQVLLKYNLDELKSTAKVLNQGDMHTSGPQKPISRYYVYTGNTNFGVQNLEYDPYSNKYYMAVYPGKKENFPNPPMFAIDASIPPKNERLCGVYPETYGDVLTLDDNGVNGYDMKYGSMGIAALGEGYFMVSHPGNADGGQFTDVKLYKITNGKFEMVDG